LLAAVREGSRGTFGKNIAQGVKNRSVAGGKNQMEISRALGHPDDSDQSRLVDVFRCINRRTGIKVKKSDKGDLVGRGKRGNTFRKESRSKDHSRSSEKNIPIWEENSKTKSGEKESRRRR